jgi:1-acyl-sn-glycerol-3-phosphate acyltransferase
MRLWAIARSVTAAPKPGTHSVAARDLSRFHKRTREKGVNKAIFWTVRIVLGAAIHAYFSLERTGRKNIPKKGPVILAANHRSFLDPFVVGCCLRRPVYFVAKRELFDKPWQGWLLNRLGAFPIKRGESDEESMATARGVLERGGALVIFPEGTRIRKGHLGRPKRGVGRLALETGAPVVPVAVIGTDQARRGWKIRPAWVRVRCGPPLTFPLVENPSPRLAEEVTARLWPCVELQWNWLGSDQIEPVEALPERKAA